jgi:hypothetical protein
MKYWSLTAAVLALAGFFSCLAFGQEPQRPPSSDTAALEKQIAELESKLAPLQKQLQKLRQQLHEQFPTTVIPMKFIDAVQAAEVVEKVYQDKPGILVEALPKMKCVAVRADKGATTEIKDLLRRLDEAAQGRFGSGAFGGAHAAPRRLDDIGVLVQLYQWHQTKDHLSEKK